jgi:Zn-dependent protease with chaperone function
MGGGRCWWRTVPVSQARLIETVLAHELGYHVHRDIPLGIAVESVVTLGGLWLASRGLRWSVAVLRFAGPADVAAIARAVGFADGRGRSASKSARHYD